MKTPQTPPDKIPALKTLTLIARELEMAGFATVEATLTERDGTRWQVSDTPRGQPVVTYLGPLLADTAEHTAGKVPA